MRKPNKNRIADDAITHPDIPHPRSVPVDGESVISDAASLVAAMAAVGGGVSDAADLISGAALSLAVASTFVDDVGVSWLLVPGSEAFNAGLGA